MRFVFAFVAFLACGLAAQDLPPATQHPVDFKSDVEPIFKTRCQPCHGAKLQSSGLRLDAGEFALKGGYGGASIKPGDSAASALIQRVAGMKGVPPMPPAGPRLSVDQVGVLRAWIDQGAKWPAGSAPVAAAERPKSNHWAFQPIRNPGVPTVTNTAWAKNDIDRFVLARLEKDNISVSPEADRITLLRRLSFDLIGLPPTPTETEKFLNDKQSGAYERQLERLLSSKHYAERWARHWLDLARYADSDGYEKDWFRPYAWRFRQWVINALDADMPFDQFTREQLAGDQLPGATAEQRTAAGFLRMTLFNREGGIDNEQFRFESTLDRAATVGSVWMGLTVACAQCHDHKFDPTSQKDFYAMYGFFDNIEEITIPSPMPGELGPYLARRAEYQSKRELLLKEYNVAELQADWEKNILYTINHLGERTDWDLAWDCVLKLTEDGDGGKIVQLAPIQRTPWESEVLTTHFVRNYHFAVGSKKWKELKLDQLDTKLKKLKGDYPQLTQALSTEESRQPRQGHVRVRGNYKDFGIEVNPDVPAFLPALGKQKATRADLANWLTSKENPLTARVVVNRYWAELFGTGLVKTVDDFGLRGDAPPHPELLDYLASRYQSDWSLKNILREIVLSATYRQSSKTRTDLESVDPQNRLLARQSRLRLPAEAVRDAALTASGLLNPTIGGPSVRPLMPNGVLELGYGDRKNAWPLSEGPDRYRRGLYITFLRTTPYPQLMNFDAPKGVSSACSRERSNTSLQALNLLNDPVFFEAAQALAFRTLSEGPTDFPGKLGYAFRQALNRLPSNSEAQLFANYFAKQKALLDKEPTASLKKIAPWEVPTVEPLDRATWTLIASTILNLDEFITRE